MSSFLNTSDKVIEIAMSLAPDSITWVKWSNLPIHELVYSDRVDEAWELLLQTALQDNPEPTSVIV